VANLNAEVLNEVFAGLESEVPSEKFRAMVSDKIESVVESTGILTPCPPLIGQSPLPLLLLGRPPTLALRALAPPLRAS
jgi:hypothetical protein